MRDFSHGFFEAAAVSCINDDVGYSDRLRGATIKDARLTDEEQECVKLLLRARAASLRYIL